MKSIFKDIPGYEGKYEINNEGVLRIKDYRNSGKPKLRKVSQDIGGYLQVDLWKNAKYKVYKIHYLVILTFIGPRPEGLHINHIDGNKHNNHVGNLEYCTSQENVQHARQIGLNKVSKNNIVYTNNPTKGKFGKLHHNSKPVKQLSLNGNVVKIWDSFHCIGRGGFSISSVHKVCNGKRMTSGGFKWNYL